MKVIFRADASVTIGTGHVMRCLTLAEALRGTGAEVGFVCRELEGNLVGLIEARGFEVHALARLEPPADPLAWTAEHWQEDAAQTASFFEARADWLVVDHYALDERWERELRGCAERVMILDDLADRVHDCDLLLDQNYSCEPTRYDALVPAHCRKLLGPAYALLRDEFGAAREWPREVREIKRVLVFFGGTDPTNETAKALRALQRWGEGKRLNIDVVIGGSNPHRAELESLVNTMPNALFHVQASNMAALMARADLSVGAGGSTIWERFCLGLPSLVLSTATNQETISKALAKGGCHLYLGDSASVDEDAIVKGLEKMDTTTRRLFARRGERLVDGRGAARVVRELGALTKGALEIREARSDDCERLYAWRNHETVRRHALDPAPLALETHRDWFARALQNPDRHLLVGELVSEHERSPVGVVRYDVDRAACEAEVSIYLAPEKMGEGLGGRLLERGETWLREREPNITSVKALVKPQNEASVKLFTRSHFEAQHVTYSKSLKRHSGNNREGADREH